MASMQAPTRKVLVAHCQREVASTSRGVRPSSWAQATMLRTMPARKIRPTSWTCPMQKVMEESRVMASCITAELRK